MALYIPQSIFHLARLLYVRPETFGPRYVHKLYQYSGENMIISTQSVVEYLIEFIQIFLKV